MLKSIPYFFYNKGYQKDRCEAIRPPIAKLEKCLYAFVFCTDLRVGAQ